MNTSIFKTETTRQLIPLSELLSLSAEVSKCQNDGGAPGLKIQRCVEGLTRDATKIPLQGNKKKSKEKDIKKTENSQSLWYQRRRHSTEQRHKVSHLSKQRTAKLNKPHSRLCSFHLQSRACLSHRAVQSWRESKLCCNLRYAYENETTRGICFSQRSR